MAGYVGARVELYNDGTLAVKPTTCPVDDPHRIAQPTCFTTFPDGEFRSCIQWVACTAPQCATDRRHPTRLRLDAIGLGARTVRCGVLCQAQKRNRPAGC